MNAYATKLSEGFAKKTVQLFYQKAVADEITNSDYEGEVKDTLSKLNILTFDEIDLKDYTGSNLTVDDVSESVGQLITDQQKAYYFRIKSLDQFKSWIKNPEGTLLDSAAKKLKRAIDAYVLGIAASDTASGQRLGTDYTTGTVSIVTGTGVVTGVGTTFTAAMVGKGFKATGHSKWYRVKTFSSTTSITIEIDSDDETSAYDGGTISGATYNIQANTAVQVTKTTIYNKILGLKTKLDVAEIPEDDRWLVGPADVINLLLEAPEVGTVAVPNAYENKVQKGYVGNVAGFNVFKSQQTPGDSTSGYRVTAGHKAAITMAMGFTESGVEDLIGNFGKAYKGLSVYGAKVVDERRKALAELFCTL